MQTDLIYDCTPHFVHFDYKFTGKERDAESGLDYFGARFDSSSIGRFMSPDWAAKVEPVPYAKLGDPQSLNLYAYVGNNPASLRDADGHQREIRCNMDCEQGIGEYQGQEISDFQNDHPGVTILGLLFYENGTVGAWGITAQQMSGSSRSFSSGNGAVSAATGQADYSQAVDYLRGSSTMAGVVNKFENGHVPIVFIGDDDDRFENGTIYWNPNAALNTTSGGTISPALALGHEMTHATGRTLGTIIRSMISDPQYDNLEERRVITRFENPAAIQLHESVRTDHSCAAQCTFYVPSPIQH